MAAVGVFVYLASGPAPPERYTTTPDPCVLVSAVTLRAVVGDVTPERSDGLSVPFSHDLECEWQESPENPLPSLLVRVSRYHASGGISGADHARTAYEASEPCRYHLTTGSGEACARRTAGSALLMLTVVQDNITVLVSLGGSVLPPYEKGGPYPWNQEEVAPFPWDEQKTFKRLAQDVLTRLAVPGPAPTP